MFRCALTGRMSKPGEKSFRLTVSTRPRVYVETRLNEETRKKEEVEVGSGFEIVKEIVVSEEGLSRWSEMTEEHKARFAE